MNLNRRDFLKLSGITLAGAVLPGIEPAKAKNADEIPVRGRILKWIEARQTPALTAPVTENCLPDSVYPILNTHHNWVKIPSGYIPENAIQPMLEVSGIPVTELPAWVEVIAPYAAVRRWCAPDAPLLARPGHGAVMQAIHRLPDRRGRGHEWLQVKSDDNHLTGWLQAHHVQPALMNIRWSAENQNVTTILKNGKLNISNLAQLTVSVPENLPTGEHTITHMIPGITIPGIGAGIPWHIQTHRDLKLHGVYWHNDFHQFAHSPADTVEMPVLAAKTLFHLLKEGQKILVV